MLLSKLATVASVGLLFSMCALAVGCAAPTETTTAGAAALETDEGFFKLYDESAQADALCDVHTVFSLTHQRADGELRAHLTDKAEGSCRINVDADARDYIVYLTGTDCGSKIYKGESKTGEKRSVVITDNRERLCDDYVPAIVVEETGAKGEGRTLQAQAQ